MKKSKKKINNFLHSFFKKYFFYSLFKYFIFFRTFRVFKKKINVKKQELKFSKNLTKINNYEYKITSQNNEDGIIEFIFNKIANNKYFVEIGFGFYEFNSLNLIKKGWKGKLVDFNYEEVFALKSNLSFYFPNSEVDIICKKITKNNINQIVNTSDDYIDFFSLDIDGNDYWVLKELNLEKVKVVCCEYNHWFGPNKKIVLKYNENFNFIDNGIFGASLLAINELMKKKGFFLIAVESSGTNAFFVKNEYKNLFDEICPIKSFISEGRFYNQARKNEIFINVKNSNLIEVLP